MRKLQIFSKAIVYFLLYKTKYSVNTLVKMTGVFFYEKFLHSFVCVGGGGAVS